MKKIKTCYGGLSKIDMVENLFSKNANSNSKTGEKNNQNTRTDSGCIEGYASIFNVRDEHNDVVRPGAFQKSLQLRKQSKQWPKMLWQHNTQDVIGVWTHMYEDHLGLFVRGKLLLDVAKGREASTLIAAKAIDSLSIGYRVGKASKGIFEGKRVNYLETVDLFEVSLVTFAANVFSKIEALKSAEKQEVGKVGAWGGCDGGLLNSGKFDLSREVAGLCVYVNGL
jgi:HK97 family phage prohead protease